MNANDLSVVLSRQDDARHLISAGKERRWDIVKWVIAGNLALAAAAVDSDRQDLFLTFTVLTAAMGLALLWHNNSQMTEARDTLRSITKYVSDNQFNIALATGTKVANRPKGPLFDFKELAIYSLAIPCSVLPAIAVFVLAK